MIPLLGWAAMAVTSAVIAAVVSSDDDSTTSVTSSDRKEREREVKEEAFNTRNKGIKRDITQYKKRQIMRFSDKYGIDIEFISGKYKIIIKQSNNELDINPIEALEEENKNLAQLIATLEEIKNESVL